MPTGTNRTHSAGRPTARTVGDYLFLRGRAFFNTLFLVVLSVLASLTVNPLAAYALSRFRLKGTEKILLFLLAVWMYHMSTDTFAGKPWCVMAGFVLVSIPTAAVFLRCQKVILRGIVFPSMK